MAGYKLTYFDVPALGEPIRWLFSYGGIEFEDIRITFEEWPALKPSTPFGLIPLLEYDGKVIPESIAISRYVAKLVGLTGKDQWEDLEIDAIVDTFNDLKNKIVQAVYETDEARKAKLVETVKSETVPYYVSRFEDLIKKNNGYLVGGHLTWADIYISSVLEYFKKFDINAIADNAVLSKWFETVISNENIQAFLKKHPLP